jgi:hypothetical protein
MLATPKGMVRAKYKFVEANVIAKTCYFMVGGDDDHGKLFQGNKRHHRSIGDNFYRDTKRLTLIIVIPFLTHGISTF